MLFLLRTLLLAAVSGAESDVSAEEFERDKRIAFQTPVGFRDLTLTGIEDPRSSIKHPIEFIDPFPGAAKVSIDTRQRKDSFFKQDEEYFLSSDGRPGIENVTCEDFARDAYFHPNEVLEINWVAFYSWPACGQVERLKVHRFSIPSTKFVALMKKEYGDYLERKVDWARPKLRYMDGDVERLLVAVDRNGHFDSIQNINMPDYKNNPSNRILLPVESIRMKVKESFLMIMICNSVAAMILAADGHVPKTYQLKLAAARLAGIQAAGGPIDIFRDEMLYG